VRKNHGFFIYIEMKLPVTFLMITVAFVTTLSCNNEAHTAISTDEAPKAIGPYSQAVCIAYSQAVCIDNLIFLSGQIGINPETGTLAEGVEAQTVQVLENLKQVLKASSSDMDHVIKSTIYLTDMDDYKAVNNVYEKYFQNIKPARATVQVVALPKGALLEIECIATRK